jgi:hypothetical protein
MPKFDIIINGELQPDYIIAKNIRLAKKCIIVQPMRIKKGTARFGNAIIVKCGGK